MLETQQLRGLPRFILLAAGLLAAAALQPAVAQTQQQLELLRSLPADQQSAVLEQLTGDSGSPAQQVPEFPSVVTPIATSVSGVTGFDPERIGPNSTIVIELTRGNLNSSANALISPLLGTQLHQLDDQGQLVIYGLDHIALGGLTEMQAEKRLQAVPELRDMTIKITLLPLSASGRLALKPFGYDLFQGASTTFAPATDIPVPVDYVIGPGDVLSLQLFGKQNSQHSLPVGRDGVIYLPEIGPVNVAGMSFSELRDSIDQRIGKRMIGVNNSITLDRLRSIRVFVLGDSAKPGAYTVSSLSTMTHALYVSGGIRESGSLRKVQLKRRGRVVRTLDLYDLLLFGDTRDDLRLQPEDVIFVPPRGNSVTVMGAVNRPAIYEFANSMNVASALALAGGANADADLSRATIERQRASGGQALMDVSLKVGLSPAISNGDVLMVHKLSQQLEGFVALDGHVDSPKKQAWRPGLRASDVLGSRAALKPRADLDYALLLSTSSVAPPRSFSPASALATGSRGGAADPELLSGDRILIFDIDNPRSELLGDYIASLRSAARLGEPSQVVRIAGRVAFPGEYPREIDMTVADLVRAAGGLTEDAYVLEADLLRRNVGEEIVSNTVITVNIGQELAVQRADQSRVQAYDSVVVRQLPDWKEHNEIEILGEVRFPGSYTAQDGETLQQIIARAGGLTAKAHAHGAVFTREILRQKEASELDQLRNRLSQQLAYLSLTTKGEDGASASTLARAQAILEEAQNATPVGRLVIDLEQQINSSAELSVELEDGDKLFVPKQPNTITVVGEVQFSTSHLYQRGTSVMDYVNQSGGLTALGDRKGVYVVRADGRVTRVRRGWFKPALRARAGDTIVVPMDIDRTRPLTLWTNVAQIVYQIGLSVAAFKTIGAF